MRRILTGVGVGVLVAVVACGDDDSGGGGGPGTGGEAAQPPPTGIGPNAEACRARYPTSLDDKTAKTVETAKAEHEPTDSELKLAAFIWAYVAVAAVDGELNTHFDLEQLNAFFDSLAAQYPTTFAPTHQCGLRGVDAVGTKSIGFVQQPLKRPFACDKPCAPDRDDLFEYLGKPLLAALGAGLGAGGVIAQDIGNLLSAAQTGMSVDGTVKTAVETLSADNARDVLVGVLSIVGDALGVAALGITIAAGTAEAPLAALVLGAISSVIGLATFSAGLVKLAAEIKACEKWKLEHCGFSGAFGVIKYELRDTGEDHGVLKAQAFYSVDATSTAADGQSGTLAGKADVTFEQVATGPCSTEGQMYRNTIGPERRTVKLNGKWRRAQDGRVLLEEITPTPTSFMSKYVETGCGSNRTTDVPVGVPLSCAGAILDAKTGYFFSQIAVPNGPTLSCEARRKGQ